MSDGRTDLRAKVSVSTAVMSLAGHGAGVATVITPGRLFHSSGCRSGRSANGVRHSDRVRDRDEIMELPVLLGKRKFSAFALSFVTADGGSVRWKASYLNPDAYQRGNRASGQHIEWAICRPPAGMSEEGGGRMLLVIPGLPALILQEDPCPRRVTCRGLACGGSTSGAPCWRNYRPVIPLGEEPHGRGQKFKEKNRQVAWSGRWQEALLPAPPMC